MAFASALGRRVRDVFYLRLIRRPAHARLPQSTRVDGPAIPLRPRHRSAVAVRLDVELAEELAAEATGHGDLGRELLAGGEGDHWKLASCSGASAARDELRPIEPWPRICTVYDGATTTCERAAHAPVKRLYSFPYEVSGSLRRSLRPWTTASTQALV